MHENKARLGLKVSRSLGLVSGGSGLQGAGRVNFLRLRGHEGDG